MTDKEALQYFYGMLDSKNIQSDSMFSAYKCAIKALEQKIENDTVLKEDKKQFNHYKYKITKFTMDLLSVLYKNKINTPVKALTVPQIILLMEKNKGKSYSTTYRHLCMLEKISYLKCGFDNGIAPTYFITNEGSKFLETKNMDKL